MSALALFYRWGIIATLVFLLGWSSEGNATDLCAQDEPSTLSMEERVDGWFGRFIVAPMGRVLFYDLVFWDNVHPYGYMAPAPDLSALDPKDREEQAAKLMIAAVAASGKTLQAFDESKNAYVYGCRVASTIDAVTPILDAGAVREFGPVSTKLFEMQGQLMAKVSPQTIDLAKYGLQPLPEGAPSMVVPVEVPEAPFPLSVDLATGQLVEADVELSWSILDVGPGTLVRLGEQNMEVASIDRRKVNLWSDVTWEENTPLERSSAEQITLPAVVFWLVLGASFFTVRFSFINLRAVFHAVKVTAGHYDEPGEPGEVTHFQALSSALSATVGLGNIAGVAIAVTMGGAGAIFWMVVAGFLGMSSKFAECTLGVMYRKVRADGSVSGGPMHYLSEGLAEMRLGALGKVLAVLFALMCIGGSLGGGNMFQGNQSFQAIADLKPMQDLLMPSATGLVTLSRRDGVGEDIVLKRGTEVTSKKATFALSDDITIPSGQKSVENVAIKAVHQKTKGWTGNVDAGAINAVSGEGDLVTVSNPVATKGGASQGIWFGLLMMSAVALVIVGGIKRIGAAAAIIVPSMCALYVLACMYILIANAAIVPDAFATILQQALTPEAGFGGVVGALITGFRRASFSNEAGIGSASIAHSAAATSEPVREGIVSLLEPFIDTIIVCTMTGLVIVTTQNYIESTEGLSGISLTSLAFEKGGHWSFPWILAVAVTLFAFSTMISWSYYGERAATWLLGDGARVPYKVVFLICAAMGPVFTLGNVLEFSDLMVLGMAFPNILGVVLLSGKVATALKVYMGKLRAGEFDSHAA